MLKPSLAVLLSAGLACSSSADEMHVPSQYATIQAAIDAAVNGDEIVIAAGTYHELLDGKGKSLTYTGAGMGQTVLSGDLDGDGWGDGTLLNVNDDPSLGLPSIAMADLTITDATLGVDAFDLQQGSFVRCEISGTTDFGISSVNLQSTILIDDCEFHSNDTSLRVYGDAAGSGVVVSDSTMRDSDEAMVFDEVAVVVRDSELRGHSELAVVFYGSSLSILNCEVRSNTDGGIEFLGNSLTVLDSVFEDNSADRSSVAIDGRGGYSTTVQIERSTFRNNTSSTSTGTVSATGQVEIVDCVFEDNIGGLGSALDLAGQSVLVHRCEFRRNAGTGTGPLNVFSEISTISDSLFLNNGYDIGNGDGIPHGGGGLCIESGRATIDNCTFIGNKAVNAGGVMAMTQPRVRVTNSRFYGNTAIYGGGAFSGNNRDSVSGCVFVGNTSLEYGGVYTATSRAGARFDSCAFVDNSAPYGQLGLGDSTGENPVTNSVLAVNSYVNLIHYDNQLYTEFHESNLIETDHNAIGFVRLPNHGGDGWGDDPSTPDIDEGANDDFGDLRLTANSPAIDAGSNADIPLDEWDVDNDGDDTEPVTGAFDMDGNPRFVDTAGMPNVYPGNEYGGPIDLGPYEFQGQSCHADVNRDGSLTQADFTAWIDAFNNNQSLADQNRDGDISATDFTAWIANFNAGC